MNVEECAEDEEEDSGKHMTTTKAGQLQLCTGKCPARAWRKLFTAKGEYSAG